MPFVPFKRKSDTDDDGDDDTPDIKSMVAAHAKCPDDQKPAYRKKVIDKARGTSAMQHIPDAWLKGKPGVPADVARKG